MSSKSLEVDRVGVYYCASFDSAPHPPLGSIAPRSTANWSLKHDPRLLADPEADVRVQSCAHAKTLLAAEPAAGHLDLRQSYLDV